MKDLRGYTHTVTVSVTSSESPHVVTQSLKQAKQGGWG